MSDANENKKDPPEAVGRVLTTLFRRREDSSVLPGYEVLLAPEEHGDDDVPARLGRFRVLSLLGRGGIGVIYRAFDPELDREVAVKLIGAAHSRDPAIARSFVEEARVSARLQHPGIVPVHDIGELDDGRRYLTMKIVEGETLADLLARRRDPTIERRRFIEIFEKICLTLAYAHSRGVVHDDVKPSNAMVGAFGEVHLMDWGFSHELPGDALSGDALSGDVVDPTFDAEQSDAHGSTQIVGTPCYMAPERTRGFAGDARTDVFGLGGILCEILTGHPPYTGQTREEIFQRATDAQQDEVRERLRASSADRAFVTVAERCLEKLPADRPEDAGAVAREVAACLAKLERRTREIELETAESRARAAGDRRARRFAVALASVLVVGTVISSFVYVREDRAQQRRWVANRDLVARTVDRAAVLEERASRAPVADIERWNPARVVAEQAVEIAREHSLTGDVTERANELLASLRVREQASSADAAMLDWIERLAPHLADDLGSEAVDAKHRQQFAAYGLDVERDTPEILASRIRGSAIREQLTRRLDAWGHFRRNHMIGAWSKLVRTAELADPHATRNRIRRAWADNEIETLRALAVSPVTLDEAWTVNLLAHYLSFDRDIAIKVRRDVLTRYPSDFAISHDLACALRGLDDPPHEEIVRLATMGIAILPDSAHAHADLAFSLIAAGRYGEAEQLLEGMRVDHPGYTRTWRYTARCARYRGEWGRAADAYRRALTLGDEANDHAWLGVSLEQLGELDEAQSHMRRAVALSERGHWVLFSLGELLMSLGSAAEAELHLRRACEFDPTHALSHGQLGVVLSRQGRLREAVAEFEIAAGHSPAETQFRMRSLSALKLIEQESVLDELRAGAVEIESIENPRAVMRLARIRGDGRLVIRLCRQLDHLGTPYRRFRSAYAVAASVATADDAMRTELLNQAAEWLTAELEVVGRIDPSVDAERWALTRTLRIWQLHTELEPLRAASDSFEPARKLWAEVEAVLTSLQNR